jgi:hypothetical protein
VLALALALAVSAPPPPSPAVWRLVDRPELHVGVRPAVLVTNDGPELAGGLTLQVTAFVLQR